MSALLNSRWRLNSQVEIKQKATAYKVLVGFSLKETGLKVRLNLFLQKKHHINFAKIYQNKEAKQKGC